MLKEAFPLAWPQGWPRTRPQDRKTQGSWKKTALQYQKQIERELKMLGVRTFVISTNVPMNDRGNLTPPRGMEPRDMGVAVYFGRPPKEDFSWQDALDIHTPDPKLADIEDAFRKLAARYHPDNQLTGDVEMYHALNQHRANARAYVTGDYGAAHEQVIACDQFKEVRLNMCAIRLTLAALRQIARCGTSALLERAYQGFAALPEPEPEPEAANAGTTTAP
jgi:hypothetical protein